MKLKEAQMLGILALIAVGIILLCMWGGEEGEETDGAGSQGASAAASVADTQTLRDVYEELLDPSTVADSSDDGATEAESVIEIGSGQPEEPTPIAEEDLLRPFLEETEPAEIPLTPSEEAEEPLQGQPAPTAAPAVTHTVQKGETLSSISKKYYGTAGRWADIQEANRDVVPDPKQLMPGTDLVIPGARVLSAGRAEQAASPALATAAQSDSRRFHTVKKGETLWRIASRYYDGDGTRWKDILAANRAALSAETDLKEGMRLRIP
jgi:nucleoid-associated protein YgaU